MNDCLFCKIINGEIPSEKVYEDDNVYAFNDIDPQAPFHIIIVPKDHIASGNDLTDENSAIVGHIFAAAAKIAKEKGFAENGWGGLVAQGLGTSMLQMGNIVKNPRIWLPPTLAAAITGPVATCIFRLENGIAIASGMGTCGLVGPIGILSWDGFGGAFHWLGLILVCFVLPAVLTPLIALPMRRLGWIKPGDCKLDL